MSVNFFNFLFLHFTKKSQERKVLKENLSEWNQLTAFQLVRIVIAFVKCMAKDKGSVIETTTMIAIYYKNNRMKTKKIFRLKILA